MFYSHEVLTSRKYGVATVWLVATLGSRSLTKKVNKKEILEVNLPKACETIIDPGAPMALRLQSSLLFGVSRVYSQQCGYVLADAEDVQKSLHILIIAATKPDLKQERRHAAKPDQLILQDDPNFALDYEFGMSTDFVPGLTPDRSSAAPSPRSSLRSPRSASPLGSEHDDTSFQGLIIPRSVSSAAGGSFGLGFHGTSASGGDDRAGSRHGSAFYRREDDEAVLLDDPGFEFDGDGNMLFGNPEERAAKQRRTPSVHTPAFQTPAVDRLVPDSVDDDRFMSEQADIPIRFDDFMPIQDDDLLYANVEAFAVRDRRPETEEDVEMLASSPVAAPARRARQKKALALDSTLELRNSDLARWSTDYVQTMQAANIHKQASRAATAAKKNAEYWVLGSGLGGIAAALGRDNVPEPLRQYTGVGLLNSLLGLSLKPAGEKHDREDASESPRRVRPRSSEAEAGRGDDYAPMWEDDRGPMYNNDDTVEVGRDAPTPLADHPSSLLPWNIIRSAGASSARFGSHRPALSIAGVPSSSIAGRPLASLGGRHSARVSASPLVRHARPSQLFSHLDDFQVPGDNDDFDLDADFRGPGNENAATQRASVTGSAVATENFKIFGAAAAVDTQTAGTSQWMRNALDSESVNFLSFVEAAIEELDALREDNAGDGDDEGAPVEGDDGAIAFDALLPPATNSSVVAAQGLLHVLSLGTKSLLRVVQEEAFGRISMRLASLA